MQPKIVKANMKIPWNRLRLLMKQEYRHRCTQDKTDNLRNHQHSNLKDIEAKFFNIASKKVMITQIIKISKN